jgi:hypothetical protein
MTFWSNSKYRIKVWITKQSLDTFNNISEVNVISNTFNYKFITEKLRTCMGKLVINNRVKLSCIFERKPKGLIYLITGLAMNISF